MPFALLVIVPLVACRKADPEGSAQPVVEQRPVADARAIPDPPAVAAPSSTDAEPSFDVRAHLSAATDVVLYAVDPGHVEGRAPAAADLHGYPIRKTIAVPAAEVAAVAASVRDAIGTVPAGWAPACFDPHHGLRVTTATATLDLVICFGCSQVYAYQGENKVAWDTMGDEAEPILARYVGATPQDDEPWR